MTPSAAVELYRAEKAKRQAVLNEKIDTARAILNAERAKELPERQARQQRGQARRRELAQQNQRGI